MNFYRSNLHCNVLLAAPLLVSLAVASGQTPAPSAQEPAVAKQSVAIGRQYPRELVQSGGSLFRQDCSFCHGRDASGGESGPDLTRSKLVTEDVDGDKIGPVVRNGRPDKGMPRFDRSEEQIASLVAFIHTQQTRALSRGSGGRKGVDVADLQTGNVEAGKQYFSGAGGCATCHSPTGDLAGIASRYRGLELEEQMLYPRRAKSKVTVTLASGPAITGTLAYLDEFTVGLIDATGSYRSWRTGDVKYKVDAPVDAHVELFSKYTDDDVHNLMAYLQTLR
jgi:cytochrome c oxidase cbb3-type subunit III